MFAVVICMIHVWRTCNGGANHVVYGNFETIHHTIPEYQSFFVGRSELLPLVQGQCLPLCQWNLVNGRCWVFHGIRY